MNATGAVDRIGELVQAGINDTSGFPGRLSRRVSDQHAMAV
jgi:hypothetical protein